MQNVKPFFIKAITPLHVGSGSDLGVVDMPIQREAHTGFPKIEASSLKGAIRSDYFFKIKNEKLKNKNNPSKDEIEEAEEFAEKKAEKIFGTGDEAGKLGFSDARILFFPVKSVKGVFAYITCPMVLERLEENLKIGSKASASQSEISFPKSVDDDKCFVFKDNKNHKNIINNKYIVLEEYSFEVEEDNNLELSLDINGFDKIKERLVIISDDNFTHFVKTSTEVITRIRIDNETGTVDKKTGGLFTEEYLPTETIMYALAVGDNQYINENKQVLQIGGNTTLGKGIVEMSILIKNEEQTDGN